MIKAKLIGNKIKLKARLIEGYGGGTGGGLKLYNVEQVITGKTSELIINKAGQGQGVDMLMGEIIDNGYLKLYFIEE